MPEVGVAPITVAFAVVVVATELPYQRLVHPIILNAMAVILAQITLLLQPTIMLVVIPGLPATQKITALHGGL
jgi:protein-S-isoprenylcysteine O-methyltransferase Ste14